MGRRQFTEGEVAADGVAVWRRFSGVGVVGEVAIAEVAFLREVFDGELRWKVDAHGVVGAIGIVEVNGELALFVGEGGFGLSFEEVAGEKEAFSDGGTGCSGDVEVDGEEELVVGELVNRDYFDFEAMRKKMLDGLAEFTPRLALSPRREVCRKVRVGATS